MVTSVTVASENMESHISAEKDAGKRILAVSPSKLQRINKNWSSKDVAFEVIEYLVVTQ